MSKKFLVIILGPTAVGKTALSIELAKTFQTEIISADSRQLFKEMTIGTAKPLPEEQAGITHHFIDHCSVKQDYNAGTFETEALACLNELFKTRDVAIMVGGSGLYINAVCNGFDSLPKSDPLIRKELIRELEKEGIAPLQESLRELDPAYYERVDLANPQRLIRALEVCKISGKPYSSFRTGISKSRNFVPVKIGLNMERELLYERINQRVDQMIKDGLEKEAHDLLSYRFENALQTVGYKELFDFFDGKCSREEAIEMIKQHTRRFAKRQVTWFKRDESIHWFTPNETARIINLLKDEFSLSTYPAE